MASIKGLTIEIGGNTQPLNKALDGVNSKSKSLQSELKQVERLLKLDPKNTELLAQKQKILTDEVGSTKEKLDTLKEAERQVQEQFKKGEVGEEQYRALQREIIETEQNLKKLDKSLSDSTSKWKKASDGFTNAGTKMKGVGENMSKYVTAPIAAGLALAVQGTEELRGDLANLETNAIESGIGVDAIAESLTRLSGISTETDSNIEALSNLMAAGFDEEGLTQSLEALSGAVIKFPDTLKIEGLADGLQETLATGQAIGPFAELIERMGGSVDEFNEQMAEATTEAEKQQVALDWLAKSGLAEVNEAYRENNEALVESRESQQELQLALAELGEVLAPIMTKITEAIKEVIDWFNNLSPEAKKVILVLLAIAAVIGPLLVLLGSLSIAIGALSAPILIAVAVIAALIAIGVALYQNWDTIKAKAGELKDNIDQKFSDIKNAVTDKINAAKDAVKSAIDKIKSFFDFKWELPKIKLPHFDITGKFSLSPPQIPKFNVEWYKNGGIFNTPSIIGVGEAGREAVLPIEKIDEIIASALRKAGSSRVEAASDTQTELTINIPVNLDSGVLTTATSRVQFKKNSIKVRSKGALA